MCNAACSVFACLSFKNNLSVSQVVFSHMVAPAACHTGTNTLQWAEMPHTFLRHLATCRFSLSVYFHWKTATLSLSTQLYLFSYIVQFVLQCACFKSCNEVKKANGIYTHYCIVYLRDSICVCDWSIPSIEDLETITNTT